MRRADALSPASKAFSTSLGSVWRGLFFAFFSPIPSTVHSSVRLCCTPSSASCLPVCHSKIVALYTTSVQMAPSIQPRLKPAAWAMPQPPGGPAPAQQGVGLAGNTTTAQRHAQACFAAADKAVKALASIGCLFLHSPPASYRLGRSSLMALCILHLQKNRFLRFSWIDSCKCPLCWVICRNEGKPVWTCFECSSCFEHWHLIVRWIFLNASWKA